MAVTFRSLAGVFLALFVAAQFKAVGSITVETSYGSVTGKEEPIGVGVTQNHFLGIPFAKPPTGALRFLPPEAPEPWTSPLETKAYKPGCHQPANPLVPQTDDDCLYLNVYAPQGSSLPVMVWIHGGGLTSGAASVYPGMMLALMGNVVVVTINYRLGIYGYLAAGEAAPGNVGLQDQVMALRWVKENIGAFGGNTDRITIFGESAGAWSVNLHLISPMSQGLFQRAICQSGALYDVPLATQEERRQATVTLASQLSCPTDDTSAMLTCLQTQPPATLLATQQEYLGLNAVIIGDDFLPDKPSKYFEMLAEQEENPIDVMMGVNSEEGHVVLSGLGQEMMTKYFTEGMDATDPTLGLLSYGIISYIVKAPTPGDFIWNAVFNHFFTDLSNKIANMRDFLDMCTRAVFLSPTVKTLKTLSAGKHNTYFYYFDHQLKPKTSTLPPEVAFFYFPTLNPKLPVGSIHGLDILYTLGYASAYADYLSEEDVQLGISIVRAWTSFAETGTPVFITENGTEEAWPQYDEQDEAYLHIQAPMTEKSVRSRLLPSDTSFLTSLLPALMRSMEEDARKEEEEEEEKDGETTTEPPSQGGDDNMDENSDNGSDDKKDKNCGKRVSTIDPNSAELALFILSAVTFILLVALIIITVYYYGLKKSVKRASAEKYTQQEFVNVNHAYGEQE